MSCWYVSFDMSYWRVSFDVSYWRVSFDMSCWHVSFDMICRYVSFNMSHKIWLIENLWVVFDPKKTEWGQCDYNQAGFQMNATLIALWLADESENAVQFENSSQCVASRTRTCNEIDGCSSPMTEYGDCSQEQICQWTSNGSEIVVNFDAEGIIYHCFWTKTIVGASGVLVTQILLLQELEIKPISVTNQAKWWQRSA